MEVGRGGGGPEKLFFGGRGMVKFWIFWGGGGNHKNWTILGCHLYIFFLRSRYRIRIFLGDWYISNILGL